MRLRADGRIPPPVISASRSTIRWRRGDIMTTGPAKAGNGSNAALVLSCSHHIRAAAMNARNATIHADTAAAALRRLGNLEQTNEGKAEATTNPQARQAQGQKPAEPAA